jgi:hypothetical protein
VVEEVYEKLHEGRSFEWSEAKEKAALLLAIDELTDDEIASEIGFSRQSVAVWKKKEQFQARVDGHKKEIRANIRSRGIAITENRVKNLQRRHDAMNRILAERGEAMAEVPGGATGMLCHNVKSVGQGENAQLVDLYEFDAALVKELRETERQAAQELGQWTDKRDITSAGKPLKAFADIDDGDTPIAGG